MPSHKCLLCLSINIIKLVGTADTAGRYKGKIERPWVELPVATDLFTRRRFLIIKEEYIVNGEEETKMRRG